MGGGRYHIPVTPGVVGSGTGRRSGGSSSSRSRSRSAVHVRTHRASTKVRRDVGSATRVGGSSGRMLRFVKGKVSHLQTVGHICGVSLAE